MWDTTPVAAARVSRPPPPGAWFDTAAADGAANFFPWYLRFTGGAVAGRPFILEPWQSWLIRQAFGWKLPDGRRLYTRVFLWVPRKNGKTELLAGVSLIALLALGTVGGEVYSIAAHEEQARIVFRFAQAMAGMSPALNQQVELLKDSIYCSSLNTVFRPLTGTPRGKHGLRCSVLLGDEAHEWATADLHQFVRQSMGAYPEPLEFIISTAGMTEGYGRELWEECEQICDGSLDDDRTLVVMFAANDGNDLSDPAVWAKANPNLGVSLSREWFAAEVKSSLQLPRKLTFLKRYHFNIWTGSDASWLPAEAWAACSGERITSPEYRPTRWRDAAERLRGRACFGGLDLASTRDTCSLVWLFPPAGDDPNWAVLPRFWWPREAAMAQRTTARIPIERWEHEGAVTLTPGNTADHLAIVAQILADCELFQVTALGADKFNAHQALQDLMTAGVPVVTVDQRMMTMSPPSKRLEQLVLDHALDHGGHPFLRWQAACAAITTDANENIRPVKRRSTGKIDGVVALINAIAVEMTYEPPPQSYLFDSPLMIL